MTELVQVFATDRDGQRHRLRAPVGAVLMEVLRDADVGVEAVCGGCCACATCHVYVDDLGSGNAPNVMELELVASTDAHKAARSRLSCQIVLSQALDKLEVEIAPDE